MKHRKEYDKFKNYLPGERINDTAQTDFFEEKQDYVNSACPTECTGLMPSAPQNEYEVESYEEVYRYLPPVPPVN